MLCQGLAASQELSPNLWKKCAEASGCSSGGGSIRGDWGSEWASFFCKSWMVEVIAHIPPHGKVRAGPGSLLRRTSVGTGHKPDGLCTLCGCQSAVADWLMSLWAPCCNRERVAMAWTTSSRSKWNRNFTGGFGPPSSEIIAPDRLALRKNSECAAEVED